MKLEERSLSKETKSIVSLYFPLIPYHSHVIQVKNTSSLLKDLPQLLHEYGLDSHSAFFTEFAEWLATIKLIISRNKESVKDFIPFRDEQVDLIEFAEVIASNKVKDFSISYETTCGKKRIIVKSPYNIKRLGEAIHERFLNQEILSGFTKEEVLMRDPDNIGRPSKVGMQACLCYGLLRFLNDKTELVSMDCFISTKQGRFIYDLLEYSGFLSINQNTFISNEDEYIRSLLNNYKNRIEFAVIDFCINRGYGINPEQPD